jgi:hypothetical protein
VFEETALRRWQKRKRLLKTWREDEGDVSCNLRLTTPLDSVQFHSMHIGRLVRGDYSMARHPGRINLSFTI